MYQQLSAWVLHGILTDKHNEFFIKEVTPADDQTINKTDGSAATSSSDLGIPGITGRQLAEILVINILRNFITQEPSVITSYHRCEND